MALKFILTQIDSQTKKLVFSAVAAAVLIVGIIPVNTVQSAHAQKLQTSEGELTQQQLLELLTRESFISDLIAILDDEGGGFATIRGTCAPGYVELTLSDGTKVCVKPPTIPVSDPDIDSGDPSEKTVKTRFCAEYYGMPICTDVEMVCFDDIHQPGQRRCKLYFKVGAAISPFECRLFSDGGIAKFECFRRKDDMSIESLSHGFVTIEGDSLCVTLPGYDEKGKDKKVCLPITTIPKEWRDVYPTTPLPALPVAPVAPQAPVEPARE